jgi:ABC-type multidrug transport system fused ATPase/permease subunit
MRKQESEQKNQIARYFAKIIMSKIEILQSNSMLRETLAINTMNENLIRLKQTRSGLLIAMYIVPELFINLMKFIVLSVVGYGIFAGKFVLSDFVLMIGAINIMETAVSEFTSFYKDLQTNFGKISTMREVIDHGPLLDLSFGKTFEVENT